MPKKTQLSLRQVNSQKRIVFHTPANSVLESGLNRYKLILGANLSNVMQPILIQAVYISRKKEFGVFNPFVPGANTTFSATIAQIYRRGSTLRGCGKVARALAAVAEVIQEWVRLIRRRRIKASALQTSLSVGKRTAFALAVFTEEGKSGLPDSRASDSIIALAYECPIDFMPRCVDRP